MRDPRAWIRGTYAGYASRLDGDISLRPRVSETRREIEITGSGCSISPLRALLRELVLRSILSRGRQLGASPLSRSRSLVEPPRVRILLMTGAPAHGFVEQVVVRATTRAARSCSCSRLSFSLSLSLSLSLSFLLPCLPRYFLPVMKLIG
jgi:hypothetical protein